MALGYSQHADSVAEGLGDSLSVPLDKIVSTLKASGLTALEAMKVRAKLQGSGSSGRSAVSGGSNVSTAMSVRVCGFYVLAVFCPRLMYARASIYTHTYPFV